MVGELHIYGGIIEAMSFSMGSGIGVGWTSSFYPGASRVDNLTIRGGAITCDSLGSGSGSNSSYVEAISIQGSVVLDLLDGAVNARQILLSDVKLTATATVTRLFGVAPSVSGAVDLTLLYTTTSQVAVESFATLPALELGTLSLPSSDNWTLQLFAKQGSWTKSFAVDGSRVRRSFVTVAASGEYGGLAASRASSGYLQSGSHDTFTVQESTLFVPEVHVVVTSPPTQSRPPTDSAGPSAEHPVETPGSRLPAGVIAAIAAAGVVVILSLTVVVMLAVRHCRRQHAKEAMSMSMGQLLSDQLASQFF
jgi:hypothetical protein